MGVGDRHPQEPVKFRLVLQQGLIRDGRIWSFSRRPAARWASFLEGRRRTRISLGDGCRTVRLPITPWLKNCTKTWPVMASR